MDLLAKRVPILPLIQSVLRGLLDTGPRSLAKIRSGLPKFKSNMSRLMQVSVIGPNRANSFVQAGVTN
jgi:hypothetical protein